jgi:hypothetical protein
MAIGLRLVGGPYDGNIYAVPAVTPTIRIFGQREQDVVRWWRLPPEDEIPAPLVKYGTYSASGFLDEEGLMMMFWKGWDDDPPPA